MNCHEYREQLLEQFGNENLSADLAVHIDTCADCQKVWGELKILNGDLGENTEFYPGPHTAELVAEMVDREIREGANVTDIRPLRWLRYASASAAVVLIASTAVVWRMSDKLYEKTSGRDTVAIAEVELTDWSSIDDEMPGGAVTTLLEEYVSKISSSAGEQLLGDLTEEEAAYLETELKRGDLL